MGRLRHRGIEVFWGFCLRRWGFVVGAFATRVVGLFAFARAFPRCALVARALLFVGLPLRWHLRFVVPTLAFGVLAFARASAFCLRASRVAPVRGGTYFSLPPQRKVGKRKRLTPPVLVFA
jgi:hypothetical protein